MKSRLLLSRLFKASSFALVFLVAAAFFSARAKAQNAIDDFRPGEVLVEIKPGASIDSINGRFGTSTIQRIYGTNFYRLATPRRKKEAKFRKKLANDTDVLSAALNPVITTPVNVFGRAVIGFPGDHPTPGQVRADYLAQQLVGDLVAIQVRARGAGVIVAVIDTGIDRNHPDIKDHIWINPNEIPGDNIDNDNDGLVDDVFGWDFLDNTPDTMEQRGNVQTSVAGHGTFIAGLIALIAPNARIMPIRAFSPDGVSDAFSVAQGIKYAVDHGAAVINLSFGTTEDSPVMHDAIKYARQAGVVLVAAVGNENKGSDQAPQFPANWSQEVMGIAALDQNNHKATFSNFGSDVSVSAPGVNLLSLFPEINNTPDYAMWSGTSFATPLATAEAALLLEKNRNRDTRSVIESTATSIDSSNPGLADKLGKGRIDALRALQSFDPVTSNSSEITLLPTGVEPTARGKAEVSAAGAEQRFEIEAEQLQPRAAYKIVVDGNVIVDGTNSGDSNRDRAKTLNFGSLKLEFSTTPSGDSLPLPAALNPVTGIKNVEVRDAQNRVVLSNTFMVPTPGGSGSSGHTIQKEATLTPTSVLPQASGRAVAELDSERETLRVEAEGLVSAARYNIFADSVNLGAAVAQSGYLRVEFTSDGSSGSLLPQTVRPVISIAKVEMHDSAGNLVLQGSFEAGGDDFGGGGGGGGGGETTFQGVIESLPSGGFVGDWRVSGRTVHVTASTEVLQDKGPAVVGAQVEVRGASQTDGSTNATRIEVLSSSDGGGGGGAGGDFQREARLNPTSVIPDAEGKVNTRKSGSNESLQIEGDKLDRNTAYSVIVDGFSLGSVTTDGSGSFKLLLSTESNNLPSQVRPVSNIKHVSVNDSQGRTVLTGGPPV